MNLNLETMIVMGVTGVVLVIMQIRMNSLMSLHHQQVAIPLHTLIVLVFGILALVCVGGGIYAIAANAKSTTELNIFGAHLTTGHVGVAFVGIGIIIAFLTVRTVLKSQRELAALPPDAKRRKKKAE